MKILIVENTRNDVNNVWEEEWFSFSEQDVIEWFENNGGDDPGEITSEDTDGFRTYSCWDYDENGGAICFITSMLNG